MKTGTQRKKGRYQQKQDAGLVPHVYDRNSRSFNEGAWKHWPCQRDPVSKVITWSQAQEDRNSKNDRQFLELARAAR